MTYAGKSFNEVTDFVMKMEGIRHDGKGKALLREPRAQVTSRAVIPNVQVG